MFLFITFSLSFDPGPDASHVAVFFRSDGIKMYVNAAATDDILEFDLSTPWDMSTAVLLQSLDLSGISGAVQGITFKPDGLKMFIIDTSLDNVREFALSTAWDISTATSSQTKAVGDPTYIDFKPDGLKMYVMETTAEKISEYDLSVAWDVSTAILLQSFVLTDNSTSPLGMRFDSTGTVMFLASNVPNDEVIKYSLSAAWDISTLTFVQALDVSADAANPQDVFVKPDTSRMFVADLATSNIMQYDIVPLNLTVTKTGPGSGTVTSSPAGISCGAACVFSFDLNTVVTLTAVPGVGSLFQGWSEDLTGTTNPDTVTLSSPKTVNAAFGGLAACGPTQTSSGLGPCPAVPAN